MTLARLLAIVCLAISVAGCGASPASQALHVGLATADITPPVGYRMAGYFYERLSTALHDPLTAKAVIFRQGETRFALVICDLCHLSAAAIAQAKTLASRETGIPVSNIAVSATHTHTGPEYYGVLRDHLHRLALSTNSGIDPAETIDYPDLLARRIAQAVVEANQSAAPAALSFGQSQQEKLAFNRRYVMEDGTVAWNPGKKNPKIVRPAGPIDPRVAVLRVDRNGNQQPAAILTGFALHADTVGGTEYSADFPFYLQQHLRHLLNSPNTLSLFAQGTCGDINHVDVSTDRPQKGHAEAERIGSALAEHVSDALEQTTPLARPALAVEALRVDLPVQQFTPEEVASARALFAKIQDRKLPFLVGVKAAKIVKLYDHYRGQPVPAAVQAVRLDADTAIVMLPSEVFVELGFSIRARSPFKNTILIELANDAFGYIPTRRAFAEGNYEPTNSILEAGAGETLADAAVEALRRVAAR